MKSNFSLGVLALLAVLVVSFSTVLFLRYDVDPVGYATNLNASGEVILDVIASLSITLANDTINFGSCEVNQTQGYSILDSFLNGSAVDNGGCIAGIYPDSIIVQNDGTVNANVTVSFTQNGTTYYNDSDSWIAYKSYAPVVNNGCPSPYSTYQNVTLINSSYPVCGNLTFGGSDSVELYLRTRINASVTSAETLLLNFYAALI